MPGYACLSPQCKLPLVLEALVSNRYMPGGVAVYAAYFDFHQESRLGDYPIYLIVG